MPFNEGPQISWGVGILFSVCFVFFVVSFCFLIWCGRGGGGCKTSGLRIDSATLSGFRFEGLEGAQAVLHLLEGAPAVALVTVVLAVLRRPVSAFRWDPMLGLRVTFAGSGV